MTIVTKIGDQGKTFLKNKMVEKDDAMIEAIGTLDELQAVVGLTSLRGEKRRSNPDGDRHAALTMTYTIQKDLYEIMSLLATDTRNEKLEIRIEQLEEEIKELENKLGPVKEFLIFKNEKARKLNWVRTVCRRCERRLVALNREQKIDPNILIYINRLSDYLFMLSRKAEE